MQGKLCAGERDVKNIQFVGAFGDLFSFVDQIPLQRFPANHMIRIVKFRRHAVNVVRDHFSAHVFASERIAAIAEDHHGIFQPFGTVHRQNMHNVFPRGFVIENFSFHQAQFHQKFMHGKRLRIDGKG